MATSVFAAVLALGATAVAAPSTMVVEGEVIASQGRWTSDGSRIVTESTIRTTGGDVVVSQLGGDAGGYGMRTWPGPEPLVVGMRVAVAAHRAMDLRLQPHVVLDSVRVLAWPPGFVRTGPTKAGNSLFWESGCVYVTVDADGTKQVPGDAEFAVIDASIGEWNSKIAGCSFMNIVQDSRKAMEVGRDKVNLIKFRDVSWCRPAVDDDPARCHSPAAAGLTTTIYVNDADSGRDGAIVDADIELNGEHFAISVNGESLGEASCDSDIANTLTHELGHLLGVEHPCLAAGDPARVDDEGNAVPSCATVTDPAIVEATMFNFQDCGETKKASLSQDEIEAMCRIYPLAEDPGACERVDEDTGCGGCASTNGAPASMLAAGLVALVLRRRRRR